jgi:hypothetical protein
MNGRVCLSLIFTTLLFLLLCAYLNSSLSFSQSVNNNQNQDLKVTNTRNSEIINFPFDVSNLDQDNPREYVFETPKVNNWIMLILNNISYTDNPEAKTIVRIKEQYPSEKFVELDMFGGESRKFIVSANVNETGYVRLYENNQDGWYTDNPIVVSHGVNQGLSVSNGKRTVIDKLSLNGFNVSSIEIYGKDEPGSPNSASGGSIQFEVLFGELSESPLYYLPLIMVVGVGGIVVFLLVVKKRR